MILPTTTTRTAPAKVNLCLRVVGRRSDGYHLLDSIFAAIDFTDDVTLSIATVGDHYDQSTVTVSCDYPGVPGDETNLAARAATAFLHATNESARVHVRIDKRIPPGAGLGGGSSNAATVLSTLNELAGSPLSLAKLAEVALSLGADVPFFLTGGCARVRGIGEDIAPIPGWPGRELIIAIPPVEVATAWAFRNHRAELDGDPHEPARLAASPEIDPTLLRNDLERVVLSAYPEVAATKSALLSAGAAAAVMSGSGSAVLAIGSPNASADRIRDAFSKALPGTPAHVVRVMSSHGSPIG